MDLAELKKRREDNLKAHKKKKRAYYLKSKLQKKDTKLLDQKPDKIDYEVELFGGSFAQKLKEIAKKQKAHIESREEIIKLKIKEYQDKKHNYYLKNKNERLEYDKEYREKKKEKLREYRKEYYRKNKERILAKQKEHRENIKMEKN